MPAERRLEPMALDALAGDPANPKLHDLPALRRSMGAFGYVEPVVLDERTGRLVSGHGRVESLRAARAAGERAPEGVHTGPDGGWLVPVMRGWASRNDDEARAYLVAANRLTENGGWDEPALAGLLAGLADADLLGLTGYSEADLAALEGLRDEPPIPVGDAPVDAVHRGGWGVYVDAGDERRQAEILADLTALGYAAKPA